MHFFVRCLSVVLAIVRYRIRKDINGAGEKSEEYQRFQKLIRGRERQLCPFESRHPHQKDATPFGVASFFIPPATLRSAARSHYQTGTR